MKKVFSVFVAVVLATMMCVNAAERGKFIHVDSSVHKNLKPQIAFCQEHKNGQDVTTMIVKTVNTNEFNEFTDVSRILIRFADGKAVRLNRAAGVDVKKEKRTEKVARETITKYWTETTYEVTPEVIQKLEAGVAIIKLRIVYKENDAKDYEIAEGYQAKMAADLLKSYQEASLKNRQSNGDLSDEDF
ncbi:MAG: hypothetical protein IJR09_03030 [Paludibacteraceae bacterium]|nr:hypothetical protein [Paludibacteraceae bacterium]MBR0064501.1 hypothetical protein [Paludibacteraceae bacterium]